MQEPILATRRGREREREREIERERQAKMKKKKKVGLYISPKKTFFKMQSLTMGTRLKICTAKNFFTKILTAFIYDVFELDLTGKTTMGHAFIQTAIMHS